MINSLYKLQIFATVVRAGSFSAAAEQMLMTQSGVSQHIHDLEASLGTKLFKRGRRGVIPTSSGEILHDYVQQIMALVSEAENAVMNVENLKSGQVRIGSTPGVSTYLLPNWLQRFRQRFPNFTVHLSTDVTPQIIQDVYQHKLDIGFVEGEIDTRQNPNLTVLPLQTIELYVIVGRGHEWCKRDEIHIEELGQQPFITRQRNSQTRIWLDDILNQHEIELNIVAEFDNPESIKNAVMSGMGITIMPNYSVSDQMQRKLLNMLPIAEIPLQRELKLVWDGSQRFSPITNTFLSTLTKDYPQLLKQLE